MNTEAVSVLQLFDFLSNAANLAVPLVHVMADMSAPINTN